MVGESLMPMLRQAGWVISAYSRQSRGSGLPGVEWHRIDPSAPVDCSGENTPVKNWICIAPIWVLPNFFGLMEAHAVQRVVALSSTSRFTKEDSSDPAERAIAQRLAEGETRLQAWADANEIEWVILRPTLIYGRARDRNITEIARFVRRFGFFPLLGKGDGLRQPIHVEDVAAMCLAASTSPGAAGRAYDISGGETLPYHEMVRRIFAVIHRQPRILRIPLVAFRVALAVLHLFPRYRHWSAAMAERMNRDLVFEHADAARDLGFSPRPFRLTPEDVAP